VFARIVCSILALGVCACVLLAARQVRIQAAHELADARRRIVRLDSELYRLRAQIASRVAPHRIHIAAEADRLSLRSAVASPDLAEAVIEPQEPALVDSRSSTRSP
jgi:hypothetical protein